MHTKLLIRPETFISRYQQWRENRRSIQLESLRISYANEVFGEGSEDLKFEQSPIESRISWEVDSINQEDLGFLLDYFRDLLIKNHYFNQSSDERMDHFDNGLNLTVHRHFLQPAISFKQIITPQTNDLFGNIALEHHFNQDKNTLIISVQYLRHKSYLSFEKLMEILLKE